jgi:Tetratricopeptide repeat/Peptidase C39 family
MNETALSSRLALLSSAFCLLLFSSCTTLFTPRSQHASQSATVIPNMPMQKWGIESCGAGSLSTVLQHYGDTTAMAAWDAELPKVRGGVMTVDLLIAARKKGFDAQIITADRGTVQDELRHGHPVILMLKVIDSIGHSYDLFHYIVADGIDPDRGLIRTQFGDGRERWVTFDRLENAWAGGSHTAILIRPHDPLVDSLRAAVALEDDGKYADAAASYRQILAAHPDSLVAWTNLGNAAMQLKQNREAEEAFRKALSIDPASRDALNNLSWLLYEENRLPEAEALARRAIAQPGPDSYLVLDTLARILSAKGACAESAAKFREAIESVPASRPDARRDLESALAAAQVSCKSS